MDATDGLFFYPVFTLGMGGLWYRGRALLLGDAVHAVSFLLFYTPRSSSANFAHQMPPGGHSVGLACEDAVLVARLVEHSKPTNLQDVFPRLAELRRPRIDKDYIEVDKRWEGVKTVSWWWQMIWEWFYGIMVYMFGKHIDKSFGYNIFKQEL